MEYKWFAYLVNHLKSVESTVKISELIKKEIFQPLTLNSQNALLDEQKCELQLSIITIFTKHRLFITAIFLTIDNMWYIWSHVGQFHSFWKERTLVEKETLRIHKKAISPWSDTETAKGTHEPQQESTCKRIQWWTAPVSIVKCLWNLCGLLTTGIWTVWDCALERIGKTHLQPIALLLIFCGTRQSRNACTAN